MSRLFFLGLTFIMLVASCDSESTEQPDPCEYLHILEMAKPASVEDLLKRSDTFVVARFVNVEETDSLTAGLTTEAFECIYPANIAELSKSRSEIFAVPEIEGAISRVAALADPCHAKTVKNTVCDVQVVDAGEDIDGGCEEIEIEISPCKLPEWHYLIPKNDDTEYGIFLATDSRYPEKTRPVVMILEISGDVLDMSVLESGEKIALDELAAFLHKNAVPGVAKFWW